MKYVRLIITCAAFIFSLLFPAGASVNPSDAEPGVLSISTFDVDVTPPVGYIMPYGKVINTWDLGLRAKGIILSGAGKPIVVIAIDWISLSGASRDEFRRVVAEAAVTTPERVTINCLHAHDTPKGDMKTEFFMTVLNRLSAAIKGSLPDRQAVTHIGLGSAIVYEIASNRRIPGENGSIISRWTATPQPALRAEPEGLIDPVLSAVSFWNKDKPVAVLNFYASHPQSYYRTGMPNPDFPGIARFMRQLAVPDALQIYFTGAGGNTGAGKYNDGSHEMRGVLAERLADGMSRAWENTRKFTIESASVSLQAESVVLIPDTLKKREKESEFITRYKEDKRIYIECLKAGPARILFMPGELFVEYQIAAKSLRPDLFVAMAAYGDCGPGYIPTAKAFNEGGYEVESSNVTPQAEDALMKAVSILLKD